MDNFTINFHVTCHKCGGKITPLQDLEITKEQTEKEILHVNFKAFPCDSCITELAKKFAAESLETLKLFNQPKE